MREEERRDERPKSAESHGEQPRTGSGRFARAGGRRGGWLSLSRLIDGRYCPGGREAAAPPGVSGARRDLCVLVDGGLQVEVAADRGGVGKREDLGRPEPADAVLAVDPVVQVRQSRPALRAGGATGRGDLLVSHERQ